MSVEAKLQEANAPDFREAVSAWAKIGCLSFGGPAAQIALMHKVVVEEKGWLEEKPFLNALNFCMLLPGPEAMQLATYVGWRLHGTIGGLVAGLLFVLPGALVILVLASLYSTFGQLEFVQSLFLGIKAAVIIIVIEALIKVSKRALKSPEYYGLAIIAFAGVFALSVPFPLIILLAALYGYIRSSSTRPKPVLEQPKKPVSIANAVQTIAIWLVIWFVPFVVLWAVGSDGILVKIAAFFSKLAVVTFGGAYAVLAYMAQDVVQANEWLTTAEMVDGLGLAETTPGPLILVTEFVGFLAAEKVGGLWWGIAGAFVTLWVTFIPCFLWIFAGAPYLEWIASQPRLSGALSAITAVVVGVILNLSLWFAIHVFFAETTRLESDVFSIVAPVPSTLDWKVVALSIAVGVMLIRWKWNLLMVLVVSAVGGLFLSMI
ncbi:MAG: chromate efflux transporter [Rhizobiaceae bacterium]|nr:chromate efflux transporter [Rhizobiaceae bacterium]